jgi:transposase
MALECRGQLARSSRELERLAQGNPVIQAQAEAVGLVTACVLWVHLGDPHDYHCAAAYRKAMGLNLKERSSGKWRGRLKISKRGSGQVRRWLFYAALRMVQKPPVRRWYRRKKARDQDQAGRALIGVMRKTALALYHVGARGVPFDVRMVFGGNRARRPVPARVGSARESIG